MSLQTCLAPPGDSHRETRLARAGAIDCETPVNRREQLDRSDVQPWQSPALDAGRSAKRVITGLQRAQGKLRAGFRCAPDGDTRIVDLFQQGCLKARLPRSQCAGEADLVMLNTAGGLTGGDRLSIDVAVTEGARATVTTPACERIYRSLQGEVLIDQRLRVGRGARLDWIPQETILYDRGRVRRRLDVELDADAGITIVEAVLLGRAAMGETITAGSFADLWRVRRGAGLVFVDATRIAEPFGQVAACPATLGGRAAMATLMHAGAGLTVKRDALRTVFDDAAGARAGASVIGEILVARIVAAGGSALRPLLVAALSILRDARPLPRLWFC